MRTDEQQDYFALFGIQASFRIDKQRIEDYYLKLQALLHPDRFVTASEQERRISAQKSAYLNEAYNTLMDDCSRATYLLELKGVVRDDQSTMADNDFLIEQMELRERLEEASGTESGAQLVQLSSEIKEQNSQIEAAFEQAYTQDDLNSAYQLLDKMRFMKKLLSEIKTATARQGG